MTEKHNDNTIDNNDDNNIKDYYHNDCHNYTNTYHYRIPFHRGRSDPGELRAEGPVPRPPLGAEEHPQLRRRPEPGHGLRPERRGGLRSLPDPVAAQRG